MTITVRKWTELCNNLCFNAKVKKRPSAKRAWFLHGHTSRSVN